jgi:sugar transferase (PEP-CTERM system associated)
MIRIFSQYVSLRGLLLMFAESLLIVLSVILAVKIRFWTSPTEFQLYLGQPEFAMQTAVVVGVCLACFYFNRVYDLSHGGGGLERFVQMGESLGAASLVLGFLYFLFPSLLLGRGVILIGMSLAMAFVIVGRNVLDRVWRLSNPGQNVIVLGTGELALEVARELTRREDLGMKVRGFVSGGELPHAHQNLFGFPVLGSSADLESIAEASGATRIVVAIEDRRSSLPTRDLVTLRVRGMRVEEASTLLSGLTGRIPLKSVRPSWFVFSDGFYRSAWTERMKRVLDLAASIVGLVLSSPLMAITALAVRLDSKGPILYRQTRVGRMGKTFDVLKFRSMKVDAEQNGVAQWATLNDPRTTRLGKYLRKYRLDELPQFFNVIRGEMSFVGPRPERPAFVDELRKSIPYYDERHSVRPGITGWAQVQYKYGASEEDAFHKLEYDLFYLKNMSLAFDLAIILKTIRIVTTGFGGR